MKKMVFPLALGLLALNQFVLPRWVGPAMGDMAANFVFILIRIFVYLGIALILTRFFSFRRFQSLSAVALLLAIEHFGFRVFLLLSDYRDNPAAFSEGLSGPLFGLAMSYMIGLPLILLVAFLGTALGHRR